VRISSQISIATCFILFSFPSLSFATDCLTKSGVHTVPLLELYTSEACSSCPPADKWMSGIKQNADQVTPLAFHVDYWDYIGWKDNFSKPEYSDRQRKLAAFAGAGFVYTQLFVMIGRVFKCWDNARLKEAIEKNQKIASRANLYLNTTTTADGATSLQASVNSINIANVKNVDIFVAIYENNLVSKVNAGENIGRELKQDYVVRHFFGAYQLSNQNAFRKSFKLKPEWKSRQAGAVIFLQDNRNGEIFQSLQLPFCS